MNDVTSGNAAASRNAITSITSSGSNAAKATTRNAVKKAPVKRRTPMMAYGKRQQSIWGPKVNVRAQADPHADPHSSGEPRA